MLNVITYQITNSIISSYIHLYQFVFHLDVLFTIISTTYTTSTITSTIYTITSIYSTVISTSSTTDASCETLSTAGMLSNSIHTKFMFNSTQLLYQLVCFSLLC